MASNPRRFSRGEVWSVDLQPVRGHEQGGPPRPALIVSVDLFNQGPSELLIIVPLSTRDKGIPIHVSVQPLEAGLAAPSWILCDQVRTITRERVGARCWGRVTDQTMLAVEQRLATLLGL